MHHSACSSCCLTSLIWLQAAWSLALVRATYPFNLYSPAALAR